MGGCRPGAWKSENGEFSVVLIQEKLRVPSRTLFFFSPEPMGSVLLVGPPKSRAGRFQMEEAAGLIAPPGVGDCGAPTTIHEGGMVALGEGSRPAKRKRTRRAAAAGRQNGLVRNHRRSPSLCPVGAKHGCQSITAYYDGACLVSVINGGVFPACCS